TQLCLSWCRLPAPFHHSCLARGVGYAPLCRQIHLKILNNMQNNIHHITEREYHLAGHLSLVLRLVAGWTYFSAFWRRLFLANKLDPEAAGYIGEKFNHFLPNALGIKPMIEFLVTHPDILWW